MKARLSCTYAIVIVVVTGVSRIDPPPSVVAVSVSGMKPDVAAASGVGEGEYGTSGSTPDPDDVGVVVEGAAVLVVVPVHAATTSSKQGRNERVRGMGDARECSRSGRYCCR